MHGAYPECLAYTAIHPRAQGAEDALALIVILEIQQTRAVKAAADAPDCASVAAAGAAAAAAAAAAAETDAPAGVRHGVSLGQCATPPRRQHQRKSGHQE